MKPIAIWYHCLFYLGTPPELQLNAVNIVSEQMWQLGHSGLLEECGEMVVGINGGQESQDVASLLLPAKAARLFHGLESRSENATIIALHQWSRSHPGWNVLYLHAKGCSRPVGDAYGQLVSEPWRRDMMQDLVTNWPVCVHELNSSDIVCSRWLWNMCDGTQHIPAGNFLFTTSEFIARLPDMQKRAQILEHGVGVVESRYEAEVFWGNGARPRVTSIRDNSWAPWKKVWQLRDKATKVPA